MRRSLALRKNARIWMMKGMKAASKGVRLSESDLSNHLACNHLTPLDLRVATGEKSAVSWKSPERGLSVF
jgi:hypothetical protein